MYYLHAIYEYVFDAKFDGASKSSRLMQSLIYLVEELGVNPGEYGFDLSPCGVYSFNLCTDVGKKNQAKLQDVKLNEYTRSKLDVIKSLVALNHKPDWLNYVAVAHFTRKYVAPTRYTKSQVCDTAENRCPNLTDRILIEQACEVAFEIYNWVSPKR